MMAYTVLSAVRHQTHHICAHQRISVCCRIRSFLRPNNAGITAAEALTAPFFTYDQDKGFFLDA